MPTNVTIPITDEAGEGVCTAGYTVHYRRNDESAYTIMYPNPMASPIEVSNLVSDSTYHFRIYRNCCTSTQSLPAEFDVTT